MLQYSFQIFSIFVMGAFIQVNHAAAQEHAAGGAASLSDIESRGKCTAEKCTCANVPQWNGTKCVNTKYFFPEIEFQQFKYLPGRMFLGLRLYSVWLKDPDMDTVADNFLEGILGLDAFAVKYSSIKGTDNVDVLIFSLNKLTYIPPKLLNPMRRLYLFFADHNNLLHVDNLFSVTRPRGIYLAFNNITKFSLPQNPKNSRWGFRMLEMDLSYNFIKETSLSLSSCNINHEPILAITKLVLNGNKILNLNKFLRCLETKRLEIILTQIQYLTQKDFLSIYGTEELLLRENQIGRIDTDTFEPFNTTLWELDLSFNRITCINGSVKYLYNLGNLNLSHNSIQTFADDEFSGLDSLQYLYLQYNQVKSLGTLQNLNNLKALDISHNNIIFIKPDQLPKTLKSVYVTGNPMICDCNLKPFLIFLEEKNNFEADVYLRFDIGSTLQKESNCPSMCLCSCMEREEDLFMFVDCSSRNLYNVPQFSNNSLPRLGDNGTIASSVHRGHRLEQESVRSSFQVENCSIGINLENNSLEFIGDAQLPPNLSRLLLSNNRLRFLPDSLFDNQMNLEQMSLSGNPWICNCETLKFKNWLISNWNIMLDFDNIRCGISDKGEEKLYMSAIWALHDSDLCPSTNFTLIFSVGLCVLIFVICLSVIILFEKYKLNVKVLLYSHGITFIKEEDDIHPDKVFDAFMSFSHEDDEFVVKEIVYEIENRNPNIRLCLHYRHFLAGLQILSNIIHAVANSKVTVLILTKNFLNSEWCLTEFRTAYDQTLEDKLHKIIIIKVGELPKEMDPGIKAYLKRTTYLTWGETNFWKKLLFVLPSRTAVKYQVLRNTGEDDVVTNCSVSEL